MSVCVLNMVPYPSVQQRKILTKCWQLQQWMRRNSEYTFFLSLKLLTILMYLE